MIPVGIIAAVGSQVLAGQTGGAGGQGGPLGGLLGPLQSLLPSPTELLKQLPTSAEQLLQAQSPLDLLMGDDASNGADNKPQG